MKITIFCIIGYYICVHHEGTICENLSLVLYLYADFVIEKVIVPLLCKLTNHLMISNVYLPVKSSLLTEYCYIHAF